jgi:hypothetical protein
MTSTKYIGMDVHKESISIAVLNVAGKIVMECVIETKASTILQFIDGLRGDVRITFEEGTWAAWLYDLLKPHVTEVVVCNPRKNALLKDGSKSARIDARKLAEQLHMNKVKSVYHGEHGLRTLRELARSYLTSTRTCGCPKPRRPGGFAYSPPMQSAPYSPIRNCWRGTKRRLLWTAVRRRRLNFERRNHRPRWGP